jgi:hypothetical protein
MTESETGDVNELRSELEELKRRNEELEAQTDRRPSGHRWRRIGAVILIVVASVLAPISTMGLWLRNTVTDTERYVDTIEPLVSDPAIQSFVAQRVTQRLFSEVDVATAVEEALPERAAFLSGALTSGLETVVTEAATRLIESDQFQQLWVAANRLAQEQLVAVLTGEPSGVVTTEDGIVSLDLSGIASAVVTQLQQRGIDLFNSVDLQPGQFTIQLFQSDLITRVQVAFDAFDTLATVLPWVTILLFIGGILLFPDKRRGGVWAAVGLSLGMAFLLLALAIGRSIYLGAIPSVDIPQDAAAAMFDTLVRFLRQSARALLAVAIVALVVLVVMGPGRSATRFRAWVARLLGRVGDEATERGVDFGPVGQWIGRNLTALRIATAVLAAVVLVAWEQPTATVVFVVALIAVLVLAVIEVLGRGGRVHAVESGDAPSSQV